MRADPGHRRSNPALDAVLEQVRRAYLRAEKDRAAFAADVAKLVREREKGRAIAIFESLRPEERAVVRAILWLGDLHSQADTDGPAVEAALRVGLCLLEELMYRANANAAAARKALDLGYDILTAARRERDRGDLDRLVTGYRVIEAYSRGLASVRGKKRRGHKSPIKRAIERICEQQGYSYPAVLGAIRRMLQLCDRAAGYEEEDGDDCLLDIQGDPLSFTTIDDDDQCVVYRLPDSTEKPISFKRVKNIVTELKKSSR
jgi:hypothetical protein